MDILVTGASGFLGKFLCPYLENQGHKVIALSSKTCDLTQPNSLYAFNAQKFDQIYHLAAWTQAGDFCLRHPGEQWVINQKINTHVLDWWRTAQPQAKMIAIGTSCSYDPTYPLTEENYLKGSPIDSLLTYGMTKRMLLYGLMALSKQFGLEYLYVVPSTLYGPNYHTDQRQLHFIFDLIRKFLNGAQLGTPVALWGDGEQKRELIHVHDFVQAMTTLAKTQKNMIVNIGAGKEHSIKQFAQMISSYVGYPFEKVEFDLTKYVGARSKVLVIDRLLSLMPSFQPKELQSGLEETMDWFKRARHYTETT